MTTAQNSNAPTDHSGLRVLSFDECLRRLAECPVGRIAFSQLQRESWLPVEPSPMTWIRIRSTAITGRALRGDTGRRSLSAAHD